MRLNPQDTGTRRNEEGKEGEANIREEKKKKMGSDERSRQR